MKRTILIILIPVLVVGMLFWVKSSGVSLFEEDIKAGAENETSVPNIDRYSRDEADQADFIWAPLPHPKKEDSDLKNLPNPTKRPPVLLRQ